MKQVYRHIHEILSAVQILSKICFYSWRTHVQKILKLLTNALKPVVLPGEKMKIVVIKEGKDPGQGIGYLDDGTMVVVDSGKKYVGEEVFVTVTSVLQTPAGRMIFARYEHD